MSWAVSESRLPVSHSVITTTARKSTKNILYVIFIDTNAKVIKDVQYVITYERQKWTSFYIDQ